MSTSPRKPYPADVSDGEWAFVAPDLALVDPAAPQRRHDLREGHNALRWSVRAGAPWRRLPTNFPPWAAVHQQAQRRIAAGCCEEMVHGLRAPPRSTPERGHRAGDDGHKRTKGSKAHAAVDALGHLLALRVAPASDQERAQAGELAEAVREATGWSGELARVDQGDTGEGPAAEAAARGVELAVVKLPQAKRGFVPLPRRWVVERAFARATRSRRLAKDHERRPGALAGPHGVASACLMLHQLALLPSASP